MTKQSIDYRTLTQVIQRNTIAFTQAKLINEYNSSEGTYCANPDNTLWKRLCDKVTKLSYEETYNELQGYAMSVVLELTSNINKTKVYKLYTTEGATLTLRCINDTYVVMTSGVIHGEFSDAQDAVTLFIRMLPLTK